MSVRLIAALCCVLASAASAAEGALLAGAAAIDITPTRFPVIVNGMFEERTANRALDPLYARCLILDDGAIRLAIVVVDSCMLPRELLDETKTLASKSTGIPVERILISATHTHSAPAAMGCLGSDADADYQKFLVPKLAEAIEAAAKNLQPAKVGHAVVQNTELTNTRRWINRPDRIGRDPFGDLSIRANMHPGYQSTNAIGASGPPDPDLSVLSVQTADGKSLCVLANYSMHYFSSPALSADYFGLFAKEVAKLLGQQGAEGPFVAMMSQGTSGDSWYADYSRPQRKFTIDQYAGALAKQAVDAISKVEHNSDASLAMAETTLKLRRRVPDEKRLAWARERIAKLDGKKPRALPDIYAREAIFLHEDPERELKLQAIRIGDLGITAIPNEVYALTGLKIKAQSPLTPTFNISLANGSEGYIPPPEQHELGGYTTWPARTAALVPEAEPRIVNAVVGLLEQVSGKPRRSFVEQDGEYAVAIRNKNPKAYWRMGEWQPPVAYPASATKPATNAAYEEGVVFYLDGPASSAFSGPGVINRSPHFAGGRMKAKLDGLGQSYSVSLWFWNGMPAEARPVAGYLFSRGADGDNDAVGDHLGIGGTHAAHGKLIFFNGNKANQLLSGNTIIDLKRWNNVVLVRDGKKVLVYLNGNPQPELAGDAEIVAAGIPDVFIGGRNDNFANFEGKIDEVAVFSRALSGEEIAALYKMSGMPQKPNAAAFQRDSEPKSPEESLKLLHVKSGYEVELVACEPLIVDPVAIDWGLDGKLWVVEMHDYPMGLDNKMKPGGRIKYLDDTNGDGRYDKATLFLDGVNMPTGIIVWRNGVIVTAAPEIFYAEDSNRDGKADVRRTLYKGFKEGNPQLRINGLRWGLDGWLYCANGWSGGLVESVQSGTKVKLERRDVHIRPDEGLIETVPGVSQFGRTRDDFGNWFGVDNSHPIFHYIFDDRYLKRNPHVAYPDPKSQVMLPANPKVFPLSRPQKRYHSWEQGGHFTSACSVMIDRDHSLFPSGIHAFVCEPVHNLVHHEMLIPAGVTFTSRRADDEKESEFLASEDPWFRPVMTRQGPDGALYVVDMYRYMIEHPDWLPAEGKDELRRFYRDGDDKGRIYRVFPKGPRPQRPVIDHTDARELAKLLDSSNGWLRDAAQQSLLWRHSAAALGDVRIELKKEDSTASRIQKLYTLHALGLLTDELIIHELQSPPGHSPEVKVHALRLAEKRGKVNEKIVAAAARLVQESHAPLRLQLAFSLGQWNGDVAGRALASIAIMDASDPYIAAAVLSSAPMHLPAIADAVAKADPARIAPIGHDLAVTALALKNYDALAQLISLMLTARDGAYTAAQMESFSRFLDTLALRKSSLDDLASKHEAVKSALRQAPGLFAFARAVAAGASKAPADRAAAVSLLGREPAHRAADLQALASLLNPATPGQVQTAAVRAIARTADSSTPQLLLANWPRHLPAVRVTAIDLLIGRERWALALLVAVQAGQVPPTDLDPARRDRLQKHASAKVRDAATKTFGALSTSSRQQIVDEHRSILSMKADARRGATVFKHNCATCHRSDVIGMDPQGQDIGPGLQAVRGWSPDAILTAILDPDRAVEPRYLSYIATLNTGEQAFGIITAESANTLTIKGLDAAERQILRTNLKTLESTNRSLMPLGFESAMSKQELADLIAYIKHPDG